MLYQDMIDKIALAYDTICIRIQKCKDDYEKKGIFVERVAFEEIDLEDIMESLLLPLLPELIDRYLILPVESRLKAYRVYVATLCEIVKNGLTNSGILKTMDARMGIVFDRNHHYDLLNRALRYEGIPLIPKHRKYEETIINEAGIPRGYRKKSLEIFSIYWKWLRNFGYAERRHFVTHFFNDLPLDKIYIIDPLDKNRLTHLRSETASFTEKIIKTCLKLDAVFSAIDEYPETINSENLNDVLDEISRIVGFSVLSVIRSDDIRGYILDYANKVSFLKFSRIIESLPSNELITLPNGNMRKASEYRFDNYIGGRHMVRGNAYEVSFPISLSIENLFELPTYTIKTYGNAVIYTSDEPIIAEIDGVSKTGRTFIDGKKKLLYVFYERISPATFAYIDGIPVNILEPFSQRTYIGKYWDGQLCRYRLGLFLSDIRFANSAYSMRKVQIVCNGKVVCTGSTNSNGAYRIRDKVIPLDRESLDDPIQIQFVCNNSVIEQWSVELSSYYLWAKQTGLRINHEINVSDWIGEHIGILFTKEQETECEYVEYLYEAEGFNVYKLNIDLTKDRLELKSISVPINHTQLPYLSLETPFEVCSDKYCISENSNITVNLHNVPSEASDLVLVVEHENDYVSYNIKNLDFKDLSDVRRLINNCSSKSLRTGGYAGDWKVVLFQGNKQLSSIEVVVAPTLRIAPLRRYYSEGDDVVVVLSTSCPCFETEGEYTDRKKLRLGRAELQFEGNYVYASTLSTSVFIDRCDISKEVEFVPTVWGIRQKNEISQHWNHAPVSRLSTEELGENSIYICSTGYGSLRIDTRDDSMNRFFAPGFSRINCRRLFDAWHSKNNVCLLDEFSGRQSFTIDCNPRYEYLGKETQDDGILFAFRYTGPIETQLHARVFSGSEQVSQVSRNVYQNKFIVKLRLGLDSVSKETITIEAKIGEYDYQVIASDTVTLKKPAESPPLFALSTSTGILSLMEYHCSTKKQAKRPCQNNLIHLLQRRR